MRERKRRTGLNRRQFMKAAGLAGATLGGAGLGFSGLQAGKDPRAYSGWVDHQGSVENFARERFAVSGPVHEKVGPTRRVDARTEVIFSRFYSLMNQWKDDAGLESLDPLLQSYYNRFPKDLETDLALRRKIYPSRILDQKKYGKRYVLATAWSKAMGAVTPPPISNPPEISDFPGGTRFGEPSTPYKMKADTATTKLIKKIAHEFGATLVGIAELNPDWVYQYPMRGRGLEVDTPLTVPSHWTFAIVVGVPMSWDPLLANPGYGTSNDAYSRVRIVAYRLASFIRQLGYAARPHTPGMEFDLVVPPIMVDAGLGEQGRHGVVITPELGANVRPAVVTTNIPLRPDKPIRFGVQQFCRHCTRCADNCPSGAIGRGGKQVVRGYRRYQIDISRCHNFWYSHLGNLGCHVCIAVCPYTKKANWLHRSALEINTADPTGLSSGILRLFQKWFYPGPSPDHYAIPLLGGKNTSYRPAPWWLRAEDFIDF